MIGLSSSLLLGDGQELYMSPNKKGCMKDLAIGAEQELVVTLSEALLIAPDVKAVQSIAEPAFQDFHYSSCPYHPAPVVYISTCVFTYSFNMPLLQDVWALFLLRWWCGRAMWKLIFQCILYFFRFILKFIKNIWVYILSNPKPSLPLHQSLLTEQLVTVLFTCEPMLALKSNRLP